MQLPIIVVSAKRKYSLLTDVIHFKTALYKKPLINISYQKVLVP